MMAAGHPGPLRLVASQISRSKSVKFLIGRITPEEDHETVAVLGYSCLNQAERAPGYEPPMVTHFLCEPPYFC